MRTVRELSEVVPRIGRIEWIGVSPARRADIDAVDKATLRVGVGIDGDHHGRNGGSKRQVTLIQAEHLPVIAAFLGRDDLDAELLRRNLVVSGINLLALKDRRFSIGSVLLEGSGPCVPCSRMEETLGQGGYAAVRGHGGITARVIEEGDVCIGAQVAIVGNGRTS